MHTTEPLDIDPSDELLSYARYLIASGYYAQSQLPELLQDFADGDEFQSARIEAVIEQAIRLQLKDQESYPAVTDYDKLRQAFDKLEAAGFMVRENYTCCQTCGWSEAREELAQAAKQKRAFKGVVFFHEQDTEGAVEGGGLYLAYDGENGSKAAAQQVVEALQGSGVPVEWNGSVNSRIRVPMTWQRRFVREV